MAIMRTLKAENGIGKVAQAIDEGRIPSIEAIVEEIGEDALRPILFVCAITHDSSDREAGGLKAFSHAANAIIRPKSYGLSLQNSVESMSDLAVHDMGEDNGKTLAGIIALNRFAGAVFGHDYEANANFLTDYHTVMFKMATSKERKLSQKRGKITLNDLCAEIGELASHAGIRSARQQKSALQAMNDRVKKFRTDVLACDDVAKKDQDYISEFSQELSAHLIRLNKNPYSKRTIDQMISERTERYLGLLTKDRVLEVIEHDVTRGAGNRPMTFFDRGGNPLFHAVRKIGYSAYIEDIFRSDRIDVQKCKGFDRADNRRVDLYDTVRDCGISYMKTAIVLKELQDYMKHLPGSADKTELQQLYRFLGYQQIYRVLHDINQASTQVDSSYRKYEFWLNNQFIYTYNVLTPAFMEEFRRDLEINPEGTMAIPKPIAQRLIPIFDMMKIMYVDRK